MSLSEFEIIRIQKVVGGYVESRRPQPHIRSKLDIGYRVIDQSFVIFSIRPDWRELDKKIERPVAKATYVKNRKVWKLYWRRADLKWHRYEPLAETGILERVVEEIRKDTYNCFWG